MKVILSSFLLFILGSCGKNNDYVHVVRNAEPLFKSETHPVLGDVGKVDILWVIDNSMSMAPIHNGVIANTDKFMQEFIQYQDLDWKMGIVSTTKSARPYLGFSSPFTNNDPYPVNTLQSAVRKLGTNGSGTEITFDTVIKQLNDHPDFLRTQAHFILIMVSDEKEQSSNYMGPIFVQEMITRKSGNSKLFKAFGAFNASDFGCTRGTTFKYANTGFEAVIQATHGKAYSTCSPDFGLKLAELGKEIISTVASKVMLLKDRPLAKTIKIEYRGAELPGGVEEVGGLWIYDPEINGIRFHHLDFVDFNVKNVSVTYEIDQGIVAP